jgi:cytochrome c-type biogenesis protein CcsB
VLLAFFFDLDKTMEHIQNSLVNLSFLTLFGTMLIYWVQLAFGLSFSSLLGNLGFLLANLELFGFFICRWIDSNHFPLSNLYESLLFLSWSLTVAHFFIQLKFGSQLFIGAMTAPSAFFINAFASLSLPDNLKLASPLVPALQSNWLMMHVTLMILSYSMLLLGSVFAIVFLVLNETPKIPVGTFITANETSFLMFLDNLSYRTLGFGFPLLTIGILSGAVWANEAWGSYWSWDPKETWALVTWLVFAIYFHSRQQSANSQTSETIRARGPAIVASFGFVFLWICYLGVNLLGKGLHSYGWF